MQDDNEYRDIEPGDKVIKRQDVEYITVPDGEMLMVHVSKVQTVMGMNFDKTEEEEKLVISFMLDEDIDGKGQVYKSWFTLSLNPKSNLGKLMVALRGEIPLELDPTDLLGAPLRITLKNKESDGITKQYVDQFFKPKDGQKVVDDTEDIEEAIDEIFLSDKKS